MDRTLYLCGGCFWGIEHLVEGMPGVTSTEVGYANGGRPEDAVYERVCAGGTGFRECVRCGFRGGEDVARRLLFSFFAVIDPTAVNRQGNDVGEQYQAGVFWDPGDGDTEREVLAVAAAVAARHPGFAVELGPLESFYPAEGYHQRYLDRNPGGYCHVAPGLIRALQDGTVDPAEGYRLP